MDKLKKSFSVIKEKAIKGNRKLIKLLKKIDLEKLKVTYRKFVKVLKKLKNIFYDKVKIADEIVWILLPCLLTLGLALILKSGGEETKDYNIATNKGDEYYYKGDLDLAIEQYNLIQESEAWPEYSLEISNIYSQKQEFERAKSILKESIIIRDKFNKENTNIDNSEKDKAFINKILFIFNMNKEYNETISLGEQYLSEHGYSKEVVENMFTAYFRHNHEYKIEELLSQYELKEGSVEDRTNLSNMKALNGDFEGALVLLKEAFEINNKSLLIYDVIEEMYSFDKDLLIKTLEESSLKDNFNRYMLVKAYSLSDKEEHINKGKELYLELKKEDKNNYILNLIGYSIYKDVNYLENAYKNAEEESYEQAYIKSLYKFATKSFKDAENEAYKTITLNSNYNKVYLLLADIMNKKENNKSAEVYLREGLESKPYSYLTVLKIEDFYANVAINEINARYYLEMAISMKKNDGNLYYRMAKLDMASENYEKAIEGLEKAIEMDPENNDYYRILGVLNFEVENYEEGIEAIRYAYKLNENDVLALNNAAWYYILIERDVYRAYDNINSALNDMPLSISEENKKVIIENQNRIKFLYDSGDEDYTDIDLKLIY